MDFGCDHKTAHVRWSPSLIANVLECAYLSQNKLKRQFQSFEFKDRQRNRGFKKELSRMLLRKQEKMNGVMQTLCALKTDNSRLRVRDDCAFAMFSASSIKAKITLQGNK